ncbi:MAG: response regulator [Proteobacteria bacterium]|nr:response regulator [Pseudomonadota bacterium]
MREHKFHRLLQRQMKNAGILENEIIPDKYLKLLSSINTAYLEADQSRYIIERSMEISSQEMQALRDVLQKEKEIIQAVISDGFCVIDPFWKITSINETGANILCSAKETVVGKLFNEIFTLYEELDDEFIEKGITFFQEQCSASRIYHCEKGQIKTSHGVMRPISFSINPLPLINNKIFSGAVLIFRDISKQLESENLLKSSLKAAQESNKSKAQFLANMSHEIRTPMNGILGMLQLLMHTHLDDTQRNYANKSFECANSLLRIIGDILDFSKIEAGKVEFENKEFNLKREAESWLLFFSTQAKEKNIKINLTFDKTIPDNVKGDVFRIRQVLNNLVNNAIKFTPSQGLINIVISLKKSYINQIVLQFAVEDSGIGIKEELQGKIFEVFSQADESTTREYGGTGLGLAICKHLVNLMGGEITVTSSVGKGSVFSFTLLLEKADKDIPHQTVSYMVNPIPQFNANILLVEDNPVNQSVVNDMLKTLGCEIDIAETGKQALLAMQNAKYDLILLDCHMPDMDGFSVTREIRELEKQTNVKEKNIIVALTANTQKGTKERCFSVGMDDYLSKPVNYSHLCTVLCKHLTFL